MNNKKQVLIVTNAMTDKEVLEIKQAFSKQTDYMQVKLSLVHVIPSLPTCYFSIPSMGALVEKYYDEARHCLNQVGSHLNVAKKDQWLISGKTRTEVLRLANKLGSDFVLASAEQIKELQHSLFFKNLNTAIHTVNQVNS